jgi:hypothetical protein
VKGSDRKTKVVDFKIPEELTVRVWVTDFTHASLYLNNFRLKTCSYLVTIFLFLEYGMPVWKI